MKKWQEIVLSDSIQFNPSAFLAKGIPAIEISMRDLDKINKKIQCYEESVFSGEAKFCNDDMLITRINPCWRKKDGKTIGKQINFRYTVSICRKNKIQWQKRLGAIGYEI